MRKHLFYILIIHIALVGLWLPTNILAQDGILRWNNGDSVPGKLIGSNTEIIRWASPYFSDELILDTHVINSIVFSNKKTQPIGTFRVSTITGDSWIADIIDSDEHSLVFFNTRFGKFRVFRSAIYSLECHEHSNLLFDGTHLSSWQTSKKNTKIGENRGATVSQFPQWRADRGGHPQTTKQKTNLFYPLEWPESFEIDLEVSSATRPPGFVFALGKNLYEALRIETWVNELVVVQGTLFESVMKIEPDRRSFRLRLAYDQSSKTLKVFDQNGNLILELNDVEQTVESSGLYVYNRGQNLTLQRLRVYGQSNHTINQPIDFTKARVQMMNGKIYYGELFVENGRSYVLSMEGIQQNINLQDVDRVLQPGMETTTIDEQAELTYIDGTTIGGQILKVDNKSVLLNTAFAEQSITCSLNGASQIRFQAISETKDKIKDFDKMFLPSGSLRGHVVFDNKNSSRILWNPIGGKVPVPIANTESLRIERNNKLVSRLQPFDIKTFPNLLHLNNGEVLPCKIMSYDGTFVEFQSPYLKTKRINISFVKAFEFTLGKTHGRKENRNPITITGGDKHRIILEDGRIMEAQIRRAEEGDIRLIVQDNKLQGNVKIVEIVEIGKDFAFNDAAILKRGAELMFDPLDTQTEKLDKKLEHALIIPRFSRDNPPTHLLIANNGDIKRGTLVGYNGKTIQFESKLNKSVIPINRVARIVNISDENAEQSDEVNPQQSNNDQNPIAPKTDNSQLPITQQSEIRIALIHNPIMIVQPNQVKGDNLLGSSSIYGDVSIPLQSIQYIHFGEKAKRFKSIFEKWVVRPAKEPVFGSDR